MLPNVGPPLLALVAIVEIFFLIQNPVTVLTVRYCGKFFAPPPQKNLKKRIAVFFAFWICSG